MISSLFSTSHTLLPYLFGGKQIHVLHNYAFSLSSLEEILLSPFFRYIYTHIYPIIKRPFIQSEIYYMGQSSMFFWIAEDYIEEFGARVIGNCELPKWVLRNEVWPSRTTEHIFKMCISHLCGSC